MILRKACSYSLVLLLVLSCNFLSAQDKPATGGFKIFFEKVYLHFDRTYYSAGDNIWFKAYLVNAQTNSSINTSNNLYVELINSESKLVTKELVRMDMGVGFGDFSIGDSLAAGTYRIRAYTNWMRNFGTIFIFEKEIQVSSIPEKTSAANKAKPLAVNIDVQSAYNIQFLPEGGSLVQDVTGNVAFKADDANGKPVDVNGYVLSSKGDTAVKFKSTHEGMGNFYFKPLAGLTYQAFVQYRKLPYRAEDLPAVLSGGFVMNIKDIDTDNIQLTIATNATTAAKHLTGEMTLAGRFAGKIIYKEKFILKDGALQVNISKSNFPYGLTALKLYDETLRPYCERLVFIDKNNPVNINISTNKTSYQSKEKVLVNITVTDADSKPVKAALSLAAVDDGIVQNATSNIQSYILLESELKGKINSPSQYFDTKNVKRFQQLDLLLLTQGWRNFVWQRIADTTLRISFLPEPGITISGNVKHAFGGKGIAGMNVTLVAPQARGNKIYFTKTDSLGRYFLDGLPLYGSNQPVKINAKTNQGKKGGVISMDDLFSNPLPVYQMPVYAFDTSAPAKKFAEEAAKRYQISSKNFLGNDLLPEVIVKNKKNTPTILRDGSVAVGLGYPEYNYNITQKDYVYETVANFLVKNVPGCQSDAQSDAVFFYASGKKIRPRFIVQKQEDVFERVDYYQIFMENVVSLNVKHLVGSSASLAASVEDSSDASQATAAPARPGGIQDVFIIEMVLKPGALNNDLSLINKEINGYYEARTFYAPTYLLTSERSKPDVRTTIHWEHTITTDASGKAKVEFFNADPKTTIRINVEGLTSTGVPVVGAAKYEVK